MANDLLLPAGMRMVPILAGVFACALTAIAEDFPPAVDLSQKIAALAPSMDVSSFTIDTKGNFYIAGITHYPISGAHTFGSGGQDDMFVMKLDPTGQQILYTAVIGGSLDDRPSTVKFNGHDVDPASAMPLVLINPDVTLGTETDTGTEGCLSFPEITGEISRSISIVVRGQDLEGNSIEIETMGFLARAIQHEVDHLNGILFIDRMSSAAKISLSSKLKRLQKETQRGLKHRQRAVAETTL